MRQRINDRLCKLAPGIGKALKPDDVLSALAGTDGVAHSALLRLDLDRADKVTGGAGKVLQITPDDASCVRIDPDHIALDVVGAV